MSAAGTVGDGTDARRYRTFLSYSHSDTKWARWLMRRLEGYRVPERLWGRAAPIGTVGARIAPVFRDRDELPTTSHLGDTIRAALRDSATLVVICSPSSAKSRWVQEEIVAFKRGRMGARVYAFIVAGEPKAAGTDDDCFSPALRRELGPDGQLSDTPAEHVAADARSQGDGKEDAFIRLVAGLLGVGFDELRQREHMRRQRQLIWITAGSVAGMAITLGLSLYAMKARSEALVARNDAQRRQEQGEKLVATMLDDLKTRLQSADKLDALDGVSASTMAYFQSLNPRDLTDTTLAQQAKALTQIGQIRLAQLRYPEATAAFTVAYGRSAALVLRHPSNGDLLFDRAQAEFWIGSVHFRHGDLVPAAEWFTRYRDSALALAAIDAKSAAWQREVSSAHHNLAVLELERGNLLAARDGFARELVERKKMAEDNPQDRQAEFGVTNIVSFLGTVAERNGDLPEARARFEELTHLLEALAAKEPQNARWQERLATALGLDAIVRAITGERDAARGHYARARAILEALAAKDPANRAWILARWRVGVREAELLWVCGDTATAQRLTSGALAALTQLEQTGSNDRAVAQVLVLAWRLEAQLRAAAGRKDAAAAVTKSLAIADGLVAKGRANEDVTSSLVASCVVAGEIARDTGEPAAAQKFWERAVTVAGPQAIADAYSVLLDPTARALALLGRSDESRALMARLTRYGYQPMAPWPALSTSPLRSENLAQNPSTKKE